MQLTGGCGSLRAVLRADGKKKDHDMRLIKRMEVEQRVVYTDPRDGKTYTYLTNEVTLPA